ncbi:hypothetical protein AM571_CH01019 [Rhizobium etli 8C-3]|uniref:Uncharacterized protein n=1 Tax=Rhizobium etli 8C-3 TaxID=538025 RepID=A0A1L5P119_RHIET|nr:hypothetical protein AM571_CH01019 [Rhizobium etli 8C-3]
MVTDSPPRSREIEVRARRNVAEPRSQAHHQAIGPATAKAPGYRVFATGNTGRAASTCANRTLTALKRPGPVASPRLLAAASELLYHRGRP